MTPENIIFLSAVISGMVGMGMAFTWGKMSEKNKNGYVKRSECTERHSRIEAQIHNIHEKVNETNENVAELNGYIKAHI